MEIFKASTQYGDWKGSTSADHSDTKTLRAMLKDQGRMADDEFLVGAKLSIAGSEGGRLGRISITAYLFKHADARFETVQQAIAEAGDNLELRAVDLELSLEEFFALFKRFGMTLSDPALALEGRTFSKR